LKNRTTATLPCQRTTIPGSGFIARTTKQSHSRKRCGPISRLRPTMRHPALSRIKPGTYCQPSYCLCKRSEKRWLRTKRRSDCRDDDRSAPSRAWSIDPATPCRQSSSGACHHGGGLVLVFPVVGLSARTHGTDGKWWKSASRICPGGMPSAKIKHRQRDLRHIQSIFPLISSNKSETKSKFTI
jgi:hypothetical protein